MISLQSFAATIATGLTVRRRAERAATEAQAEKVRKAVARDQRIKVEVIARREAAKDEARRREAEAIQRARDAISARQAAALAAGLSIDDAGLL